MAPPLPRRAFCRAAAALARAWLAASMPPLPVLLRVPLLSCERLSSGEATRRACVRSTERERGEWLRLVLACRLLAPLLTGL